MSVLAFTLLGNAWKERWVESEHNDDYGKFVLTAGKFYGDAEKDKGQLFNPSARQLQAPSQTRHVCLLAADVVTLTIMFRFI